jgi:5-(carboxyamino)imidazole ribonucleotide mutase
MKQVKRINWTLCNPDGRLRALDDANRVELIMDMRSPAFRPALAGVLMGSASDWDTMRHTCTMLEEFGIPYEARVLSAHRMPDDMFAYAQTARERGLKLLIAGAGGAAHLPGMLAAKTTLPVLGVPVATRHLGGQDSLYSIVQMPRGVPVATFAIGDAGAANAGIFAARVLAVYDADIAAALARYAGAERERALAMELP